MVNMRPNMSLDLHDLRAKITPRTHAWLEARHRVTGEEVSAIVREILDQHAARELDVAKVADRLLRREGLPGITGDDSSGSG